MSMEEKILKKIQKLIIEMEDRQIYNEAQVQKTKNVYAKHHYGGAVQEANLVLKKLKILMR